MIISTTRPQSVSISFTLAIRCPGCGHQGTFEPVLSHDLRANELYEVGLRRCPHTICRTLVYFVRSLKDGSVTTTYPFLRIEFDRDNIPEKVLSALEEAISCHSNHCFVASAIMVRKTLDLLCIDRGATGADLKKRIASLKTIVVIPNELFDGMDDLRLLGNDAAHVESNIFNDIDQEEIEVAIEFTKEILKAVYQYSNLLGKLRSLKKSP